MFLEDIQSSVMKLLEDVCNMKSSMFSVISGLMECVKTFNVTTHGVQVTDRVLLFMGSVQALVIPFIHGKQFIFCETTFC
jgi:hypothetical protein